MSKRALITGVSSGLGEGLAMAGLNDGWDVYGLSRRPSLLSLTGHGEIDLEDLDVIPFELEKLLAGVDDLSLLVLNAGKLGPMAYLEDQTQDDLESLMNVNVWSNKVLVDWCLKNMPSLEQVVMVSSGASLNGNAGWGGYSISKAALNMLVKLYASEVDDVHFCSLAPGLIDTPMQDYLCGLEDQGDFPSLQRLRLARGTQEMPSPEQAGQVIWKALPSLKKFPSGSYQDIRKL